MATTVVDPAMTKQAIIKREKETGDWFYANAWYIVMPQDVIKETLKGGILYNHYESLLKKHYDAMLAHQAYYNECMSQWGYDVPDPIPSMKVLRNILFTFETYLFGWFAYKTPPDSAFLEKFPKQKYRRYVLEDSVIKMREYIEDITANRTPRCLRDL